MKYIVLILCKVTETSSTLIDHIWSSNTVVAVYLSPREALEF